jgi:hypothetical protein
MEIKTISTSTLFELLTFIGLISTKSILPAVWLVPKLEQINSHKLFFSQIIIKATRLQFTFGGAQEVAQMPDLVLAIPGWIANE